MPDDGMTQQNKFDRSLLDGLVKALGDNDPYYLQLIYSEIKLADQLKKKNELAIFKERLDKIESNHLHTLQEDIEKLYVMNANFVKVANELVEIKEWIATQRKL